MIPQPPYPKPWGHIDVADSCSEICFPTYSVGASIENGDKLYCWLRHYGA